MSDRTLIPFFERFQDSLPEFPGVNPSPVDVLQLSLQRDLTRLFNVRNTLTIAQFLDGSPTALDYGLPDTLALSAQSETDLQRWEQVILRAITLYEPRLIQVRVKITADQARPAAARVAIAALTRGQGEPGRFHFDTGH